MYHKTGGGDGRSRSHSYFNEDEFDLPRGPTLANSEREDYGGLLGAGVGQSLVGRKGRREVFRPLLVIDSLTDGFRFPSRRAQNRYDAVGRGPAPGMGLASRSSSNTRGFDSSELRHTAPITIGIERSQKGSSAFKEDSATGGGTLIQCDVVAGRHFVFMGKVGDSEDVLKIRNRNAVCLCFKCSSLEVYDARGINLFEQGAEEALLVSTKTNGQLVTRSFDDLTRSLWKREQSSKDWGIPDENEPMNLITGQLILSP
ncbi:hypothetical protein B0H13DRAFT_1917585 [Mycena leptocephala]|nr:hypothetical protein B0H13DRAFT_1917585 [Mycena leptocephala]